MGKEEQKEIVKEAIQEWLDLKFTQLGKWSFGGILAMALAALAYFILIYHGWVPPNHP